MDFTEINSLIDNAIQFITGYATKEQSYISQLAAKDQTIADLTAQLKTATSTSQANATEIVTLHDKLTSLNNLISGQAPANTTSELTNNSQASTGVASVQTAPVGQ